MWKFICTLLVLAHCCSAGPLAQQKKYLPNRVREDIPPRAETQESANAEAEIQTASAAEAETAPIVSSTLTLPSNATSIRADITDSFSCANKSYGYYADVENDCQIFHVCLPVTYADGKENTFRWSFICPEETIFSQESFTCMRREDMTIECEESYRYYDLNGNFGQPVEEEKESSNQQTATVQSEQAETVESEPVEQAPAVAPEPVQEPAKPVKVQKPKPKPIRQKPAVTYNKPQRKSPVPAPVAAVVEAIEEPEPEEEPLAFAEVAAKPLKPSRFSARPNKDRPQFNKPAIAAPTRNEIFNSIRKRPTIFNKKTVQETEAAVTEAIVQAPVELSEPKPTLKLQTLFVEPAAQASEAAVVVALPEAVAEAQVEPETAPEVESEIVEDQAKPVAPVEVAEPLVEEVKPIEAFEEIPAVIVETLAEIPQELEQTLQQESIPEPEIEKVEEPTPAETYIEPAIVEPSSNEEALNNIEALEAAKPEDAPESLPAMPEMEHPSPIVEQMLDNTETQQSIGGFKPVDPVMAAEAEQLINDFLNTLRKQEEKPETDLTPAVAMEMAETIEQQPQPEATEIENKLEATSQQQVDNEAAAVSIEEAKLPEPEIIDKNASVEEQLLEAEPQPQLKLTDSPIINIMQLNHLPADYQIPVQVVDAPEPEPELVAEAVKETETQNVAEQEESKPVEAVSQDVAAQESLATAAYMPAISIDDIVELVKERLDQNPKTEQLTPMELVLTPGAAAPMSLIQSEPKPETDAQSEVAASSVAEQESEDIIMPIYNRVANAEPAMSLVQTVPVTGTKPEDDKKPLAEQAAVAAIAGLLAIPPGFKTPEVPVTATKPEASKEPQAEQALLAIPSGFKTPDVPVDATKPESIREPQAEQAAVSAISALLAVPPGFKTDEVPQLKANSGMDARKRRFLFRADTS